MTHSSEQSRTEARSRTEGALFEPRRHGGQNSAYDNLHSYSPLSITGPGLNERYLPVYLALTPESAAFYYHGPDPFSWERPHGDVLSSVTAPEETEWVHYPLFSLPLGVGQSAKSRFSGLLRESAIRAWASPGHPSDREPRGTESTGETSVPPTPPDEPEQWRVCHGKATGYAALVEDRPDNDGEIPPFPVRDPRTPLGSRWRLILDLLYELDYGKDLAKSPHSAVLAERLYDSTIGRALKLKADYFLQRRAFRRSPVSALGYGASFPSVWGLERARDAWLDLLLTADARKLSGLETEGWFHGLETEVGGVAFWTGASWRIESRPIWSEVNRAVEHGGDRTGDEPTSTDAELFRRLATWFLLRYDLDAAAAMLLLGSKATGGRRAGREELVPADLPYTNGEAKPDAGDSGYGRHEVVQKSARTALEAAIGAVFGYLQDYLQDAKKRLLRISTWQGILTCVAVGFLAVIVCYSACEEASPTQTCGFPCYVKVSLSILAVWALWAVGLKGLQGYARSLCSKFAKGGRTAQESTDDASKQAEEPDSRQRVNLPIHPVRSTVLSSGVVLLVLALGVELGLLYSPYASWRWVLASLLVALVLVSGVGYLVWGSRLRPGSLILWVRLLLPRMTVAITGAWLVLANTEEALRLALMATWWKIGLVFVIVVLVNLVFVTAETFSRIGNIKRAAARSAWIVATAFLLSLGIGGIVSNLSLGSLLESTDYLTSDEFQRAATAVDPELGNELIHKTTMDDRLQTLDNLQWGFAGAPLAAEGQRDRPGIPFRYELFKIGEMTWYVYPAMLLYLSSLAVFAGLFLHLVIEQTPITEPF